MASTHPSLPVKKYELNFQREPILISRLSGQQELRLTLKQNEAVSGHKGYHRGIPLLKDANIKLCECFGKYIINPKSKQILREHSMELLCNANFMNWTISTAIIIGIYSFFQTS